MTQISAKVIADSTNEAGHRITTMLVTFPRIILAEFNTHRMFSRNTASSRAIPFGKMLKSIEEDPFIPIAWQKDHKGMQGTEYFPKQDEDVVDESDLKEAWLKARDQAIELANHLNITHVTKQLCNRLLEPFMWTTVIVTATEWENFFALRCPRYEVPFTFDEVTKTFRSRKDVVRHVKNRQVIHPDDAKSWDFTELDWLQYNKGQAEIHMMALAEAMYDALNESTPNELREGEWHIPFEDNLNDLELTKLQPYPDNIINFNKTRLENKIKISTVMCARTSYTVVGEDQKPLTYERMLEIHDNLLKADPKHMSPFEHCAKVMSEVEIDSTPDGLGWSGNFKGFIQYRKFIKDENITK